MYLIRRAKRGLPPASEMDHEMHPKTEIATPDHTALVLMLTYVEAECRRLGAEAAARHAALAAALVPAVVQAQREQGLPLH